MIIEDEIVRLLRQQREDSALNQIGNMAQSIKREIINQTDCLPHIETFRYNINILDSMASVVSCAQYFEELYQYANPALLFDRSVTCTPYDIDSFKLLEANRPLIERSVNTFAIKHLSNIGPGYIEYYNKYLAEIRNILDEKFKSFGANINQAFVAEQKISVTVTKEQLVLLYDFLSDKGYLASDEATKINFLQSFDNIVIKGALATPIKWLPKTEKSSSDDPKPNVALLYLTFINIGAEMSIKNKSIISERFIGCDGTNIKTSSIKQREASDFLNTYEKELRKALDLPEKKLCS